MKSFSGVNRKQINIFVAIFLILCILALLHFLFSYNFFNTLDYNNNDNWIYYEKDGDKTADTFIVAPCIDVNQDHKTVDLKDEKIHNQMKIAINMQKGIYDEQTNIFSPYYKQWAIPVLYMDHNGDGKEYVDTAYRDVKAAFEYYLSKCDESKPLILAGFSEGAEMTIKLLKDYSQNEKVQKRLAAAYCLGWCIEENELNDFGSVKMASKEDDTHVIISFTAENEEMKHSPFISENQHAISINPVNWKTDSTPAYKEQNKGSRFFASDGTSKNEEVLYSKVYIDPVRGALKISGIDSSKYKTNLFKEGVFHLFDYQFFYYDLKDNVKTRLNSFIANN